MKQYGLTAPTPVSVTNAGGQTVLQQTVKRDESISVGHLPQGQNSYPW